jgi:hypothetical protein
VGSRWAGASARCAARYAHDHLCPRLADPRSSLVRTTPDRRRRLGCGLDDPRRGPRPDHLRPLQCRRGGPPDRSRGLPGRAHPVRDVLAGVGCGAGCSATRHALRAALLGACSNPWRTVDADDRQVWHWTEYPGGALPPYEEPLCYPRKRDAVAALTALPSVRRRDGPALHRAERPGVPAWHVACSTLGRGGGAGGMMRSSSELERPAIHLVSHSPSHAVVDPSARNPVSPLAPRRWTGRGSRLPPRRWRSPPGTQRRSPG